MHTFDEAVVDIGENQLHELNAVEAGVPGKLFGGGRAVVVEISQDFVAFKGRLAADPHPLEPGAAFRAEQVFIHAPPPLLPVDDHEKRAIVYSFL